MSEPKPIMAPSRFCTCETVDRFVAGTTTCYYLCAICHKEIVQEDQPIKS